MTTEELDKWADGFEAFQARFAGLFRRSEPREQAVEYMRGLMAPMARKNGWQIAEAMGDKTPDPTQRLLYKAKWDADAAGDELGLFVVETLGDEEGIGVVDETGFLKKGAKSVGVKRQYTGQEGESSGGRVLGLRHPEGASLPGPAALLAPGMVRRCATPQRGEDTQAELTVPEVRRLLEVALPLPPHST